MLEELYPGNRKGAPSSPLRLAEEYRTYLGQAALDELVRLQVPDEAWRPGPLHQSLLKLPWAEVLTTNWDTLLERAARKMAVPHYSVVRSCADIGHARAPRIVKLHGTIGASDHLVFAEEDYRTYPMRYAPFVNLARQVFIENELVLLGFSGDDPNFLQWSGWVRDQLGGGARRIYLVGVLQLSASKRKLLEAMNVAPIDLTPLVSLVPDLATRHAKATALFLQFIARSAPRPLHEWRVAGTPEPRNTQTEYDRQEKDDAYAASILVRVAESWGADRKNYPGWLVCPSMHRAELRNSTDDTPRLNGTRLSLIDAELRLKLLYELAWRHKTAFWPVPRHLFDLFSEALRYDDRESSRGCEELEIATLLLSSARIADDDSEFEKWYGFLDRHAPHDGDLRAEAAYQKALRARDHLDFANILVDSSTIANGHDPAWKMRLASLHSYCGEFTEASRLLTECLNELNERQAEDRSSVWLRSRRAWAQWLESAARFGRGEAHKFDEDLTQEYSAIKSDPWTEINLVRDAASVAWRKRREDMAKFVPLFPPGHYRDPSSSVRIVSSTLLTPEMTLEGLTSTVGVPERIDYVNLCADLARDVIELVFDEGAGINWYRRWLRVIFDHSSPSMERFLGRVQVAQMKPDLVEGLIKTVSNVVEYWRGRVRRGRLANDKYDGFAVERLRLFIEVRSRLTARQDVTGARASFDLAVNLAADTGLRHMWLREAVGHLADYAVKAIPPADRSSIVLSAIGFPMPSEWSSHYAGYLSPTFWLGGTRARRPESDALWTSRIAQLIEAVCNQTDRSEAALRLVYLAGFALTEQERLSFSQNLWSECDGSDPSLPRGTLLFPHVFTTLPAPNGVDVEDAVRRRLYDWSSGYSSDVLSAIAAAAEAERPLRPSGDQAVQMFDRLVSWKPAVFESEVGAAFARAETALIRRGIGHALAKAVVPSLESHSLTKDRGQQLLSLIEQNSVGTAIEALPYFVQLSDDDFKLAIVRRIRRGLLSRNSEEVFGSTRAIIVWVELAKAGLRTTLPDELIQQVLSGIEIGGGADLHYMLNATRRLVEDGAIQADGFAPLETALESLLASASYNGLTVDDMDSVTISLVRAECVRLAAVLQVRGSKEPAVAAWIQARLDDPLPEVRFALEA